MYNIDEEIRLLDDTIHKLHNQRQKLYAEQDKASLDKVRQLDWLKGKSVRLSLIDHIRATGPYYVLSLSYENSQDKDIDHIITRYGHILVFNNKIRITKPTIYLEFHCSQFEYLEDFIRSCRLKINMSHHEKLFFETILDKSVHENCI